MSVKTFSQAERIGINTQFRQNELSKEGNDHSAVYSEGGGGLILAGDNSYHSRNVRWDIRAIL